MFCPLCNEKLQQKEGLFICPNGHGTLVTGKYLTDIEDAQPIKEPAKAADTKHTLHCPHCTTAMQKVDYNSTHIIIDSCTNCHYRWLDGGEITKIRNFKPDITGKDLLYIVGVDEKIRKNSKREIKEANPRIPLQRWYRGGAEFVAVTSRNPSIRLGAIIGQGLYGLIKGLINSRTSRILTITTVVIFAFLFFLVITDARHTFGL
jgi:Zn-finger nucleic acid-binding protein